MDIQSDKLNLIEWLAVVNDSRVIRQLKALQKLSQENLRKTLTDEEKTAIDQGLESIANGEVHTHESVMESTRKKYLHLFK